MTERERIIESITTTIADYREGDIEVPTTTHVNRWVRQFTAAVQLPLLQEIDHVLKKTYFSRERVLEFLQALVCSKRIAGANPCDFWKRTNFLRIQKNGRSQEELLVLFDGVLHHQCGIKTAECGSDDGVFIYIDDVMFSGNRIGTDLAAWIEESAPEQAIVHVVVVAIHTFGEYKMPQKIQQEAKLRGKKIKLEIWRIAAFENMLANRNSSEVLWPAELPDDESLKEYMDEEKKFPFKTRVASGKINNKIFSSEEGRQLLERELLLAGMKIRSFSQSPARALRPLGFSPFGLGFGSMIVTFRNCPNNCPLALWWGDPEAAPTHPFSKWYPLFPRKTYGQEVGFADFFS